MAVVQQQQDSDDTMRPIATPGSSKYGKSNRLSSQLLEKYNLSNSTKEVLADAGEYSLAKSTWSSYKTAAKLLAECGKKVNRAFTLPLTEEDTLEFIGWLLSDRKVKSTTVNVYLAGIRQLHVLQGVEPPVLKNTLVKFLLRGKRNKENIAERREPKRLPMTMSMMKLLKSETIKWEADKADKLLFWTICTMAFHGGFRIHEILSKTETEFDPDFALLTEDVRLLSRETAGETEKLLQIKLKCPKEDRTGKATIVEIYETKGVLCPIKAYEKWNSSTKTEKGLPLFRRSDGTPVTGKKLNSWLKDRLGKYIDKDAGKFTSHSFRIGLASTLAASGLGTAEIKEAGRWSSNAYEVYMKLPQAKRAKAAEAIKNLK